MSRIGIISDIHGNAVAFQAVLDDLRQQRVDQVVCLGDAIQGGPQPRETVALLRELGCPVVMGNADAWMLTGVDTAEPASEELSAVRTWSLAQLSDDDRAYIEGFQPAISLMVDDATELLCFHGSPQSFDHYIFPDTPEDELVAMLGPVTATWLTGGHTHLQQLRRIGASTFINPGSVGRVIDGRGAARRGEAIPRAEHWAEYAILSQDGAASVEYRRVPVDVAALTDVTRRSGRPYAENYIAQYRQ